MIRKIVHIDEEKCDGCGLCVPSCAEGAIKIVNGKAQIAADNLCDGLGACLGDCPRDAITIIERDADEFDETAVEEHLQARSASEPVKPQAGHGGGHHGHGHGGGCPGSRAVSFAPAEAGQAAAAGPVQSQLAQWPVQLHLVPVTAPYLKGAELLVTADCVPFAYANYHQDFLAGKVVVVGCPKLDDNGAYLTKLTEMFRVSGIKGVTVLRMEVPCCGGIVMAARQALAASGMEIPMREVTISIRGEIVER